MTYVLHMGLGFFLLISMVFPFVGISLHMAEPELKIQKSQLMLTTHRIQLALLIFNLVTGLMLLHGIPFNSWSIVVYIVFIIIVVSIFNMMKNARLVITNTKNRVYPRKIINSYINWSFINLVAIVVMIYYKTLYN